MTPCHAPGVVCDTVSDCGGALSPMHSLVSQRRYPESGRAVTVTSSCLAPGEAFDPPRL